MNTGKPLPSKPLGVIASLSGGLDAVIRGWVVVLLPVALDLFLWFGRRLSIQPVAERAFAQLTQMVGENPAFDLLLKAATDINYFGLLSIAPLGIPSLMSLKLPGSTPLGIPDELTVHSELTWLALFVGLALVGLFLGGFYLGMIAQQVRDGRFNLPRLLGVVPRYWTSLVALLLALGVIACVVAVPVLVLASLVAAWNAWIASLVIWTGSLILIWLFFHLMFTVHGLLLSEEPLIKATLNSLRLTAFNSFPTMALLLLAAALSAGLNFLWSLPADDSWMLLVGILGHALITSGLIASTFVFYQDRYRYWRELRAYLAGPNGGAA